MLLSSYSVPKKGTKTLIKHGQEVSGDEKPVGVYVKYQQEHILFHGVHCYHSAFNSVITVLQKKKTQLDLTLIFFSYISFCSFCKAVL